MSRRTQLTTKYVFQVLAQLSENFIFIYLGITLFTESKLVFKPLFILVTVFGICVARWCAVFPLSKLINWVIRVRARRAGSGEVPDELPHSYQVMLFWAGLRGAVGVALAAGLKGKPENVNALQATVLVVVVLTVVIFGGTTARMLEIMGIRTGVVEEVDSDDEFDIETTANGTYYKRSGQALGHNPERGRDRDDLRLGRMNSNGATNGFAGGGGGGGAGGWQPEGFASGSNRHSPQVRPTNGPRSESTISQRERQAQAESQNLLLRSDSGHGTDDDLWSDSDLPPAAPRRAPRSNRPNPLQGTHSPRTGASATNAAAAATSAPTSAPIDATDPHLTASGAIRDLFTGSEETSAWFHRLDEAIIKPTLLLDQNSRGGGGGSGPGSTSGGGHHGHSSSQG